MDGRNRCCTVADERLKAGRKSNKGQAATPAPFGNRPPLNYRGVRCEKRWSGDAVGWVLAAGDGWATETRIRPSRSGVEAASLICQNPCPIVRFRSTVGQKTHFSRVSDG